MAELPAELILGRLARVERLGDSVHRLRLEGDGGRAALFEDCPGLEALSELHVGDRLLVRVAHHPRGLRAVRVYDRLEEAAVGQIGYVDPDGRFAFLRLDDGGADVFIPGRILEAVGSPGVGRSEETPSELQPLMRISYPVF